MSLFDKDLIEKEPTLPEINGICRSAEDFYSSIEGKDDLCKYERRALQKFYGYTLSGEGLFQLLPLLTARKGVKVIISPDTPTDPKNPDHLVNLWKNLVLGEYYYNDDKIILYINNIRKAANSELLQKLGSKSQSIIVLLLDVFAHELYHVYFHKKYYLNQEQYEEPLAEYGALIYLNAYFSKNDSREEIMRALCDLVKSKEKSGLRNYSLGAYMFLYSFYANDWHYKLIEYYKTCNTAKQSVLNKLKCAIQCGKNIFNV